MSNEGYISGGSSLVESISTQTSPIRMAHGIHTSVAASDTVVTGLSTVVAVICSADADPIDANDVVTASIGDQAGTPAAGSILIKSWMTTGDGDRTKKVATTFSKKVGWVAFGY